MHTHLHTYGTMHTLTHSHNRLSTPLEGEVLWLSSVLSGAMKGRQNLETKGHASEERVRKLEVGKKQIKQRIKALK